MIDNGILVHYKQLLKNDLDLGLTLRSRSPVKDPECPKFNMQYLFNCYSDYLNILGG